MTTLNVSLICLSLKYLSKNYILMSNISKWIHFELVKCNYKESKFIKSLDKKDFGIIKTLIKFNQNINLLSDYLVKYCSYKKKYFDIIKLLVKNGTKKSEKFIHSWKDRALGWACANGHTDIVKLLIDNGADIHARNNKMLYFACSHGHTDVVKLLLESGMNEPYSTEVIELSQETLSDDYPCKGFKITKVIDFVRIDNSFIYACIRNYIDIVKLLIEEINKPSSFFHVDFREVLRHIRNKNNPDLIKLIEDNIM